MILIGGHSAVFCRKPRYCEANGTECSAGPGSSRSLSASKRFIKMSYLRKQVSSSPQGEAFQWQAFRAAKRKPIKDWDYRAQPSTRGEAAESSPATVALTRGLPAKGKPQEISFQPLQQAPPWFVREGRPLNAKTDSQRSQVVKAHVFCAVLTKPTSASPSLT